MIHDNAQPPAEQLMPALQNIISVLKVNLINIPKNDQIKLPLDKMKAVRTG